MTAKVRDITPLILARRRNKIRAELTQMKHDIDHWNAVHPNEEPIIIDLDISKDVAQLFAARKMP